MSFAKGQRLDRLQELAPQEADQVLERLLSLVMREVFEFGEVQTDPNFANYLYDTASQKIVLLDFGATRELTPDLVQVLRAFLIAGLEGDTERLRACMRDLGLYGPETTKPQFEALERLIHAVFDALRSGALDTLGTKQSLEEFQKMGLALANTGYIPPNVPMDALFVYRKVVGLALLASNLKAHAPLRDIVQDYLS